MDYLFVNNKKFELELALSSDEQARGMMFREPPFSVSKVLAFPFTHPSFRSFWMKNVKADLDIVYCLNNKVSSIWHGEAGSTKMLGNNEPTDLVLEFAAGTCKDHGIIAGSQIKLELTKESNMRILMFKTGLIF